MRATSPTVPTDLNLRHKNYERALSVVTAGGGENNPESF